MNPIASATMSTAVGFAREVAPEAPMILWPADWPAPELVAWTLAHMLAETLPQPGDEAAEDDAPTLPLTQRHRPHAAGPAAL